MSSLKTIFDLVPGKCIMVVRTSTGREKNIEGDYSAEYSCVFAISHYSDTVLGYIQN